MLIGIYYYGQQNYKYVSETDQSYTTCSYLI